MARSVAVAGRSQHLLLARPRVSECEEVVLALVETVSVLVGGTPGSVTEHGEIIHQTDVSTKRLRGSPG
jgi:hypothetical protein